MDASALDQLLEDLRAGRLDEDVPAHGTLHRIRQHIPADRAAGPAFPDQGTEPVWLAANAAEGGA
jgi:NADH-quinone oxidoreductase subunit E